MSKETDYLKWKDQTIAQYASGDFSKALDIQAGESPYGYVRGGSRSLDVGRADLTDAIYGRSFTDGNGNFYTPEELGDEDIYRNSTLRPTTSDDIVSIFADRAGTSVIPVSLTEQAKAIQYIKDANNGSWMDLTGRVIAPGTAVTAADGSGYYTYDPTQYLNSVNPILDTNASRWDDATGERTKTVYRPTAIDGVLYDPNDRDYNLSRENFTGYDYNDWGLLHSAAYDPNSWKWTPKDPATAPIENGWSSTDAGWWNTLQDAGMLPREEWTGTMGEGGWNAVKGIMPAVTGIVGGILNGATSAASGTTNAGTSAASSGAGAAGGISESTVGMTSAGMAGGKTAGTIAESASRYITDLTGLSKNIVDPIVGFAGNTLQNVVTGGKVDANSLLMSAAGAAGQSLWNEIKAPPADFANVQYGEGEAFFKADLGYNPNEMSQSDYLLDYGSFGKQGETFFEYDGPPSQAMIDQGIANETALQDYSVPADVTIGKKGSTKNSSATQQTQQTKQTQQVTVPRLSTNTFTPYQAYKNFEAKNIAGYDDLMSYDRKKVPLWDTLKPWLDYA